AFTKHPTSGVSAGRRGRFAGVIDKLPHLLRLGVTAVELLPGFAFDERDTPAVLDEFRDMVKALHRAGIEVILDVVYNHTGEGGADGPTISFRGLANTTYYILG